MCILELSKLIGFFMGDYVVYELGILNFTHFDSPFMRWIWIFSMFGMSLVMILIFSHENYVYVVSLCIALLEMIYLWILGYSIVVKLCFS